MSKLFIDMSWNNCFAQKSFLSHLPKDFTCKLYCLIVSYSRQNVFFYAFFLVLGIPNPSYRFGPLPQKCLIPVTSIPPHTKERKKNNMYFVRKVNMAPTLSKLSMTTKLQCTKIVIGIVNFLSRWATALGVLGREVYPMMGLYQTIAYVRSVQFNSEKSALLWVLTK